MANHLRTELVLDALNMALGQRRATGVIHHSDPGLPVHVDRVRAAVSRGRSSAVDGIGGRLLRMRERLGLGLGHEPLALPAAASGGPGACRPGLCHAARKSR